MISRTLEVRLERFAAPAGRLTSTQQGNISFSYTEEHLNDPGKMPVSLALPLQPDSFGDQESRAFFDNLLPENDQLKSVMEREGLARADIVGLLHFLGADCPGAISCVPPDAQPIKVPGNTSTDYDRLSNAEVTEIVGRLADRLPLPNEMRDPSPIAGVQQKIALTLLPDGTFGVPKRELRVPTTHILKVPRKGRERETRLEVAAALLAQSTGLDVAVPNAMEFGEAAALLIKRFDRNIEPDGTVRRLHQEDFAQALGLPSSLKYERYGKDGRRFDAEAIVRVLEKTATPAADKQSFLKTTIFNLIIGNTDNHAKNHALLYDGGTAPRLAPLYDMLPVRLDKAVTHDFSFRIGSAERFDDLTEADVMSFLASFGIVRTAQIRFGAQHVVPLIESVDQASATLTEQGMKDFDDLIGREADKLIEILNLSIEIRARDYFSPARPGWGAMS